jgi:exodeoxyribonuclease VII small subunit
MTSTKQNEDAVDGVAGLSYSEASAELDAIIEEFEAGVIDVDRLVERLERATAIVDELDRRLRRTRLQVEELVPRLESIGQGDGDEVEILEIVEIDVEDAEGEGPTGLF